MNREKGYRKLVIKVGTNVLSNDEGLLDQAVLAHLVEEICDAKRKGIEVILVSSGAVGAGKMIFKPESQHNRIKNRQILASIGQPVLLNQYLTLFRKQGFFAAQILATKEDFRDRRHYLNMRSCFDAMMMEEVIPIVNENDVIAIDELMFTDNDELASLVASMISADALFILTNVEGVFDGDPSSSDARLIPSIDARDEKLHLEFTHRTSSFGRGGMHTKYRMSRKLAQQGIDVHIVNGKKSGIISQLLKGSSDGTHFISAKKVSPVKKWIAYQDQEERPKVFINVGAKDALLQTHIATSLLPIGVIKIEGSFSKGDVLRIVDEHGNSLGLGRAQYGVETARKYMGRKGAKPLVHYDYLYLQNEIQ